MVRWNFFRGNPASGARWRRPEPKSCEGFIWGESTTSSTTECGIKHLKLWRSGTKGAAARPGSDGVAMATSVQSKMTTTVPYDVSAQLPISLCGVPVFFTGAVDTAQNPVSGPCHQPLLYEWRVHLAGTLASVYVGKARNGEARPYKTYPVVVADLHANRGIAKISGTPVKQYFPRNPWGYRWVHHELERAVAASRAGQSVRIELSFSQVGIAPDLLRRAELDAIASAKARYPAVLANDRGSMATQFRRNSPLLDPIWL